MVTNTAQARYGCMANKLNDLQLVLERNSPMGPGAVDYCKQHISNYRTPAERDELLYHGGLLTALMKVLFEHQSRRLKAALSLSGPLTNLGFNVSFAIII